MTPHHVENGESLAALAFSHCLIYSTLSRKFYLQVSATASAVRGRHCRRFFLKTGWIQSLEPAAQQRD